MKYCTKCKKTKEICDFHRSKYKKDGITSWCKLCVKKKYIKYCLVPANKKRLQKQLRAHKLKHKYNITLEIEEKFRVNQNNKCAICNIRFSNKKQATMMCVDHNHKTKKVRGLLCWNCNTALGKLKDSIKILQKAIDYLTRTNK